MTEPQQTPNIMGGGGILQAPDGRALVVIGITCGGAQFALPPMEPDVAAAFITNLAANITETATNARRHNLGLIVPANGNGHGINLGDTSALRRQQ